MLKPIDIERVRTAGMGSAIAETADKVAAVYRQSAESSEARTIAEDIIAIWLKAAADEVREALALQLRHCPFLPRGLAKEMARDLGSVAVPMLKVSEVFSEEDLLEIVQSANGEKQAAIATRNDISYVLAEALVASENEEVVNALVRNDEAHLTQGLLHRIVDTYVDSQSIHEGLAHRAALPISIAERLITVVADQLRQHLVARFEMPVELADGLAVLSREAATSSSLPPQASPEIAEIFVGHLDASRRLSPTFLLRTLCDGQVEIFKAGLARHARIRPDSVAKILQTGENEQQSNLLLRAGIPSLLVPAFRAAVDVIINRVAPSNGEIVSEQRIREVIDRIVQQYEEIDPKDLESVLMRLSQTIKRCLARKAAERESPEPRTSPLTSTNTLLGDPRERLPSRERVWGAYEPTAGKVNFGLGNEQLPGRGKVVNRPTRH